VEFWAASISPLMERIIATGGGEFTVETGLRHCTTGLWQLWIVQHDYKPRAICITTFDVYDDTKHLRVIGVAGEDFEKWAKLLDQAMSDWGRQMGASMTVVSVRRGFEGGLKKLGFKPKYLVMARAL